MFEFMMQMGDAFYYAFPEPTPLSPDQCSRLVDAYSQYEAAITELTGQYVRFFCEATL